MVVIKLGAWLKTERKKYAMKKKLEAIHNKMYNSKFNFIKILPELTAEFFNIPLKDKELDLLKNSFSEKAPRQCEDLCPICFVNFEEGEDMTKLPTCGHAYHIDCLIPWLDGHCTCPTCRQNVRGLMLQHYHGKFDLPAEETAQEEEQTEQAETQNNFMNIGQNGVELRMMPNNQQDQSQTQDNANGNASPNQNAGLQINPTWFGFARNRPQRQSQDQEPNAGVNALDEAGLRSPDRRRGDVRA